MDKQTYVLTEYYQYRLNLEEANRKRAASWHVAYTFTQYYGVSKITASALTPVLQDFLVMF